jgi:hypothetical protein
MVTVPVMRQPPGSNDGLSDLLPDEASTGSQTQGTRVHTHEAEASQAHSRIAPLTAEDLFLDRALDANDPDEFERKVIAARIADLACSAKPPINVGLFGPWGSGKSSMATLIEEALDQRPASLPRVKLIRYDAWKYGGHSLRRNFISNAASALGIPADDPDGHRFHRGLYENRRRAEVETGRFLRASLRISWRFALFFAVFIVLFTVVVALASWVTGGTSGHANLVTPKVLAGGGIVTFALAALRTIFDTSTVQIEQARPSDDEEFSEAFRQLVVVPGDVPNAVAGWPVAER